jgi:hypothetical protein
MKALMRHALCALAVATLCQPIYAQAIAAADEKALPTSPLPDSLEESTDSQTCTDEAECSDCLCTAARPLRTWYLDARVQQTIGSSTSFQFGGESPITGSYAPMSKLTYSLDSTWTGLRVGVRKPNWDLHIEWLTPMVRGINGGMTDYDWNISDPRNNPNRLDSLSESKTRWNDGQKLELEGEFKWSDRLFGLPVEFWPLAGFRFQRFGMTAYASNQVVPPDGPFTFQGDVLTLNQQYYIGYIGAQLRSALERKRRPPITLTLQADCGGTGGYLFDSHLIREGNLHGSLSTGGTAFHVALIADAPFNRHCSIGLQADHMEIRTTGFMQQSCFGQMSWDNNGVQANSDQTSVTAYLRFLR